MKKKIRSQIILVVIMLGIIQASYVFNWEFMTYLTAVISYFLVGIIWKLLSKVYNKYDFEYRRLIFFYLVLGIIAIIRGFFEADNYWDWKEMFLNSGLVMLLPIVSCIGSNREITQFIYQIFLKYLVPFSIFIYFASKISENTDGFGRFLAPLYIIILFFPFIPKKWKLFITFIVVCSFFSDLGARSNVIRIIAASGLMSLYYFKALLNRKFLEFSRLIMFIMPITLFILAVSGVFNIFKLGDNINEDEFSSTTKLANGEERESAMLEDSRTFIYEEVISSALIRNSWLMGESAVGGYISDAFSETVLGSKGRPASEVGILNVFIYLGIIGAIGFTLIFYYASFLCVNRSRNDICKLIGVFIAFRWTYCWVEEFTNFDMNYFFLWLTIGLCFSKSFRQMNNEEMKQWVSEIFDFKSTKSQLFRQNRRSEIALN